MSELYCGFCDGVLVFLGQLGNLFYFRCRQCGAQHSLQAQYVEAEHDHD